MTGVNAMTELTEDMKEAARAAYDNLEDSASAFEDGDNERGWEYVAVARLMLRRAFGFTDESAAVADENP